MSVWFYFEDGDGPHRYVGYFALVVAVVQQGAALYNNKKGAHKLVSDHPIVAFLVHNLIWALVGALALTGWMLGLDKFWGEDWVEQLHALFSWGLMVFVVLHLLGVLRDAYKYKRATWLQMVTSISPKDDIN